MSAALDRATAALGNANLQAFLHVIREGETNQTADAYGLANVGTRFPETVHPWYGKTTTEVGHSTAFGAYQELGTTFKEAADALGLGNDASPINQDLHAAWIIDAKRHALAEVENGDLAGAIAKLATEWVSLPGLGLSRAKAVFSQFGGTLGAASSEQSVPATGPQPQGAPMGIGALLQIFGPILAQMIPQVAKVVNPAPTEVANRNTDLAELIVNTIIKAVNTAQTAAAPAATPPPPVTNLQGAVEAMQADTSLQKTVQAAVVNEPDVMTLLEVGGGVKAAREADLQQQAMEKPFYKTSAVFWISLLLIPMVAWYVGASIVGGVDIPTDWPWYAQLPLKLFGTAWDAGAKVGLANLVVGLVLGGICGVYFGVSVTQAKQAAQDKSQTTQP